MGIKAKIIALASSMIGYMKKWQIDLGLVKYYPLKTDSNSTRLIVSLTSYGRRVNNVVYYTIISLLRQTVLPDRIIVWLDNKNWNNDNLPSKLKKLTTFGVEYKFCEDMRSYTKLIPALRAYPTYNIITVDDDIIYSKNIIESLLKVHKMYPRDIICRQCRFPLIKGDSFLPYKTWVSPPHKLNNARCIMPLGVSGTLYPPSVLHEDVCKYAIAKELSPLADDIWFWIMAKRKGSQHRVVAQDKMIGFSFDDLYQFFHKGAALTHINSKQNFNDEQLNRLIQYYKLSANDLQK